MSAQATAATPATEEKKSKPLAPAAGIKAASDLILAKLNASIDGESATSTAIDDTYYAAHRHPREVVDEVIEDHNNHRSGALWAGGQKNIEMLAANPKIKTAATVIQACDGVTYTVTTDRDYNKTVAGKDIAIKGRTTFDVTDTSIGKTGQMGRVYSSLKELAAASLK